eukprot:gene15868-17466_t
MALLMKLMLIGLVAFMLCPQDLVEACSDKNSNCNILKAFGYCTSSKGVMAIYCRKTCDLCNECLDALPHCAGWKLYCFSNRIKQVCKKTCGECGGDGVEDEPAPNAYDYEHQRTKQSPNHEKRVVYHSTKS